MAESILLLIILLIIIAISIGIYLYTQQNTTDDKTFSDREQQIIDKAIKDTQPIITTNIDTKLDDSNYVKTDDLATDRLDIQSNKEKIEKITELRVSGDRGHTATSTGETEGDSSEISVGPFQYIMQDTTTSSDNKIELRNKVNIANDFNICNEEENVCYKFTVDGSDNLNIVKTNIDGEGQVTDGNGKIFFKNAFELYDGDDTETDNKYFKGPDSSSIFVATPESLNEQTFEVQKKIYEDTSLLKQFLILHKDDDVDGNLLVKDNLDTNYKHYIKINISQNADAPDYKFYTIYPFSKYLQPLLEIPYDGGTKRYIMDYIGNKLTEYNSDSGAFYTTDITQQSTIPIYIDHNPDSSPTLLSGPKNALIKYIINETKRT